MSQISTSNILDYYVIFYFLKWESLPVQGHQLNFRFSDLFAEECLKKLDNIDQFDTFFCQLRYKRHFRKPGCDALATR